MNTIERAIATELAKRALKALQRWRRSRRARKAAKAAGAAVVLLSVLLCGCAMLERLRPTSEPSEKPSEKQTGKPQEPSGQRYGDWEQPSESWRTDVATIDAVDGAVTFWTSDISKPASRNRDGGHEWIIARINTDKGRILIMTMSGNRPASRIYSEAGGERLRVNVFPVPLIEQARWDISMQDGDLITELNGKTIDRRTGVKLESVTMNGYKNRESTGKWRR